MLPLWLTRRRSTTPPDIPDRDHLRRELQEARRSAAQWKQRSGERARQLDAAKEQLGAVTQQRDQLHRQLLSARVVEQMLPQRLVTAHARAEGMDARLRHETMCLASPSYRNAVEDDVHPPGPEARQVTLAGAR